MIYVDDIKPSIPNRKWRYKKCCHMWADSLPELINFAEKIGLNKNWLQNSKCGSGNFYHFDLTVKKRALASKNGAQEASLKEYIKKKYTGVGDGRSK